VNEVERIHRDVICDHSDGSYRRER